MLIGLLIGVHKIAESYVRHAMESVPLNFVGVKAVDWPSQESGIFSLSFGAILFGHMLH